jgi:steroid delta-isomerase-like uncharacterized protein
MKKLFALIVIASMFASCNNMNNNAGMMANDKGAKNEARFQQFYDQVMNAHNPAAVDSFCTPDFTDHQPDPGHSGKGTDDLKASFKEYFAAFPDLHIKTNFMVSHGDTVIAHVTMTGTNSGSMMGMPATNKSFNIDGVDIITLKDGKATDRWGYFENMKMMQQLGMMPEPGTQKMAEEGKMEKTGKIADKKVMEAEKMGQVGKKK